MSWCSEIQRTFSGGKWSQQCGRVTRPSKPPRRRWPLVLTIGAASRADFESDFIHLDCTRGHAAIQAHARFSEPRVYPRGIALAAWSIRFSRLTFTGMNLGDGVQVISMPSGTSRVSPPFKPTPPLLQS